MSRIVIVGAGECGARAAFALREKGFDGGITLIGAEPDLPYERPPLSKEGLAAAAPPKYLADAMRYQEARITVLTNAPVARIDRDEKAVELADGRSVAYDRLLLATGARPRVFPGAPENSERIRMLRTHADALAIRAALAPGRKLAVIGGGFIGLELAATARKLGAEVGVIEGLPRILSRGVPKEIAAIVDERHRREGVKILCGARIATIGHQGDGANILLADGGSIAADLLVVGIGATPNTELAEAAGLAVEDGIAVDETLRTSDPDIFAAGDCCSFPLSHYHGRRVRLEAWRNAQEQGTLVAANLMGAAKLVASVPWFWSDQYELTLQIAGLADDAAVTVRRDLSDDAFILFHLDGEGRLIAASAIGPGNAVARDIRLAEMLIATGSRPDPAALASPETKLKKLLGV
ncbi:FAD-dependent oxidoreductase (plasmid) [Sinorhizobium meliloti]|uniref:NAD(P)/FAD-dependent oxidoreductase n=2 Tax=Rhizobium meliloti TaxID=382 RepID=UPI00061496DE|nr:FAD-dependent oxidoreductase [Sinorhizobium meliloti]ASP74204.1 ferredoxin reductase [Sinorhizobium meliloti]KKA13146.1 ferredoxin reductase [Sinorhizobium meliloti]MDE3857347.1 FAD-dependent oxidoreductase [Sinorhizobium meliloti]MDW9451871.1 ferredoxin reductase [Sinorhizobium meliloti]MDW9628059.1 ferredoxin reductase [Sinorhizobium meliloti]